MDVISLTNSSGTVTKTYTYNAFGEEQNIDNLDANPFRYCGEYFDKVSGTLYFRARNYNASIGRFTQEDPIRDGGNWYSYCASDPVNAIDPNGEALIRNTNVMMTDSGSGSKTSTYVREKNAECKIDPNVKTQKGGLLNNNDVSNQKKWYEDFKNKDGTYSLYDGDRFSDKTSFHDQLFVIALSGPSFDLKNGDIGIGSLAVDAITGGWELEHFDISLLDFGHAEAALEVKDFALSVGGIASIWSPSVSISFFGIKIELGFEVGAVGAYASLSPNGFSFAGADVIGLSLKMSW